MYLDFSPQGGRLYLVVEDSRKGQELWVTDGTETGTRLVRDICRGSCGAHPLPFWPYVLENRLLFVARDALHGYEVWSTDGTASGTVQASDFAPESPWEYFDAAVAGGQLLFAGPGAEGQELWRTDGTAAGTRLVRDIDQAGGEP
jgi:ELWxxDGT repeat protein